MAKTITICKEHRDYEVPLIFTLAFQGCEVWCPYCGHAEDMFGGTEVPKTPELEKRKETYKKATEEYLHAQGLTYATLTEWQGKKIPPSELPEGEQLRMKLLRENYKLRVKAEEIVINPV